MQPTQDMMTPTTAQSRKPNSAKKWGLIAGGVILIAVAAVVVWLSWTAISSRTEQETPAAAVSITADGFTPATIVVKKGTDVVWTNGDSQPRSLVGDQEGQGLGTTEPLDQGESYSFVFDDTGKYTYHDPNKLGDKATVIVQ